MPARHRLATVLLLTSTAAALTSTAALASPEHRPPPDPQAKPELLKLRGEMRMLPAEQVKQQVSRFRALCDADGYPLVGNIATKGDGDKLQPSALCTFVREQKK